ncbi:MAG: hypothetical protein ABFD00_04980, partial [Chloroherpetonaceae bacterium]
MVRELRYEQKKHKNDKLDTFSTDVSAMARDAADMIESQYSEIVELKQIAAEHDAMAMAIRDTCEHCGWFGEACEDDNETDE